jgi:16S rRNA (uracil1498-N3)-methyltransferase
MSHAWFHIPEIPQCGERVTLDERESRHASGARRLRTGETITVFDGRGRVASATIADASGKSIEVKLGESHIEPPLIPEIHLAAALPKGDRQSVMLNMATQLGVASFTPLLCERSIVKPGRGFAERAKRICIEACKQSRNARLPVIHDPHSVEDTIQQQCSHASAMILADRTGNPVRTVVDQLIAGADRITVLIGPEGGFTDDEVDVARNDGAQIVDLGRTTLRTETAAIAMVSLLRLLSGGR